MGSGSLGPWNLSLITASSIWNRISQRDTLVSTEVVSVRAFNDSIQYDTCI